jgi:hypothetical protein
MASKKEESGFWRKGDDDDEDEEEDEVEEESEEEPQQKSLIQANKVAILSLPSHLFFSPAFWPFFFCNSLNLHRTVTKRRKESLLPRKINGLNLFCVSVWPLS